MRALDQFLVQAFQIISSLMEKLKHFLAYIKVKKGSPQMDPPFDELKQLINLSNKNVKSAKILKHLQVFKKFEQKQEIDFLSENTKFKYQGRNVLGVR